MTLARRMPYPVPTSPADPTLEALLDATEELLSERRFDDLSVAQIARRAGCAVGTVYGHVRSKAAILHQLAFRFVQRSEVEVDSLVASDIPVDLQGRVQALVAYHVRAFRQSRGIVRAVAPSMHARPEDVTPGFRELATSLLEREARWLAECIEEIGHRDPLTAARFGLMSVIAMAQNRVVFGDSSGLVLEVEDEVLERELAGMLLAYLRHGA